MIADLVEGMVRELGYEVSATAHNREAALEAIDKNDFDFALVDPMASKAASLFGLSRSPRIQARAPCLQRGQQS